MAANWGEFEVTGHVNGDRFPGEVKAMMDTAGESGGKQFSKSFDKNASPGLKRSLENFSKSFRAWDKNLAGSGKNFSTLGRRVRAFMKTVGNTEPMIRFRLGIQDAAKNLRQWAKDSEAASASGGRQGSMWKRLSANTRQWTAIIAAVIGSIGELAALSSAAGAGIFILGSAFGSLIVGGLAAISIFNNLNQDISKAPAAMRPVIKEFGNFKKVIGQTSDAIALAAFGEMGGAFTSLGRTLKGLTPALKTVGKVLGGLVKDFAKGVAPGTEAFKGLSKFIGDSAKILDKLGRIVGKFGLAVLRVFNAANPLTEKFVGWVGKLVDRFDAFTKGPGLNEWLKHADSVFGAFGRLLDTTGRLLNDLVTDKTVKHLTDFVDHIDGFLSGGGKCILEFAQNLDIFGLLAKALDDLGKALGPLLGPLGEMGTTLNLIVGLAIDTLAPIISDIAKALAPFVKAISDFMRAHPKEMADALLLIGGGFLFIKKALPGLEGAIGKVITKLDEFVKKGPSVKGAFTGVGAGVVASIATLTSSDKITLGTFGSNIVTAMLLGLAGGPFGVLVAGLTAFVATALKDAMDGGSYALSQFAFKPGDPVFNLIDGWGKMLTGWRDSTWIPFWTHDLPGAFSQFGTSVDAFGTSVDSKLKPVLDGMWTGFTTFMGKVEPPWNVWWGTTLPQSVNSWGATVTTNVKTTWTTISAFFTTTAASIGAGWNSFWGGLPAAVNQFGVTSSAFVHQAWANISAAFTSVSAGLAANWNRFWGGLPAAVNRFGADVERNIRSLAGSFERGFQAVWNTITGWVNKIAAKIREGFTQIPLIGGALNNALPKARGGILTGPTHILGGEAGPEAIVPLRRSLSQVDKSVRGLSAVAQGKTSELGGSAGNSRTLNVQPGAIVINGVRDPNAAALGVVNRLAERIAG